MTVIISDSEQMKCFQLRRFQRFRWPSMMRRLSSEIEGCCLTALQTMLDVSMSDSLKCAHSGNVHVGNGASILSKWWCHEGGMYHSSLCIIWQELTNKKAVFCIPALSAIIKAVDQGVIQSSSSLPLVAVTSLAMDLFLPEPWDNDAQVGDKAEL